MWVLRAKWLGLCMHFVHRVVEAIHHHIEAHIEDMLVIWCIETRCDEHPILGFDVRGNSSGTHDAGEFHLVLDCPILVEIPVEPIFIIANSGNERDDQAARAPDLSLIRSPVDMLPQYAEILFVHTYCVRHNNHIAAAVDCVCVKIMNVAQAVTS